MAGCNCDLDSCSSSQSTYQATQPVSKQSSTEIDLSGYGGQYAGVRIPSESPSQQTEPTVDNQAPEPSQKPVGFIPPPIVKGGCQMAGAAEYNPATNMIHLCMDLTPAQERYAIAHELAHAIDFQEDLKFEADEEYWADQYAVNSLLQKSDCEAVESRAVSHIDIKDDYTKGILYAREMHSIHCR